MRRWASRGPALATAAPAAPAPRTARFSLRVRLRGTQLPCRRPHRGPFRPRVAQSTPQQAHTAPNPPNDSPPLCTHALLPRIAQVGVFAALMGALPYVRDRMLADPRFLFKVGCEVGIDGFLACFAEARRVAHDFWSEAEFFVSDLLVGCVLDASLVTLLAAPAKLGAASPRAVALARGGRFAPLWAAAAELPASLVAAAPPGIRYTLAQRAFGFALKSLQFGAAGAACGLVGQGMANTAASARAAMRRKRDPKYAHDAHTLIMPPLARTALVWGLFMGASAHSRLQAVVAIERIVESLPVAQRVGALPLAVSLIIRTANNIIGGEQFVDLARWAGVQ